MLRIESNGPVSNVTLARPEVRNALSDALIAELRALFLGLEPSVRAVVLTGEGSAFCAGGDLEWMRRAAAYTEEQNFEDALRLAELFEAMATCRAVVIAAVNGHAFGGGAGLVAAADVAIAADKALFCFSEARLGLLAATISRHVLPKIGPGNARWLFSTAEAFSAEVALRVGLVHDVVSKEDLSIRVQKTLEAILTVGPNAAHQSKLLAQGERMDLEGGARLLSTIRSTSEAAEGISAFLEKRPAAYVTKP